MIYHKNSLPKETRILNPKMNTEGMSWAVYWEDEGIRVEKARWGRHHIIRGKQKLEIGKEVDASKLSLEDAEKYLGKPKAKPKKKATKKR